jgi:hypothetical protein
VKRSDDLVIGKSGDRKSKLIAETLRCGEEIGRTSTTEGRRHGEESSPGSYQGTGFSRAVKDKNIWASAPAGLKNFVQTMHATLREIFDESAYDRFLLRTNGTHSVASYRDYMRERDAAMAKKPRCC